jgi:uncharacterized protein (DUF1778 family)
MPDETPRRKSDDRMVLPVSIPTPARRLLKRAADRRHTSLSAFIRDAAVREANRVLGIEPATAA